MRPWQSIRAGPEKELDDRRNLSGTKDRPAVAANRRPRRGAAILKFSSYLKALLVVALVIGLMGWLQAHYQRQVWSPPPATAEEEALETDADSRVRLETALHTEVESLNAVQQALRAELQPPQPATRPSGPDAKKVAELEQTLARQRDYLDPIRSGYLVVRELWRTQVIEFSGWLKVNHGESVARLPEFRGELYYPVRDGSIARGYLQQYTALHQLRIEVLEDRVKAWRSELEHRGQEATRMARLRTSYLAQLYALGYVPALDAEAHWSDDMALEVTLIPTRYRVIAILAGMRYQHMLDLGYPGYYGILESLAWLLLIVLVPVAVYQGQKTIRRRLLQNLSETSQWRGPRPLLSRLFPWLVQYAIFKTEVYLIQGTVLQMATPLLQAACAYIVYRGYLEVVESQLVGWVDWLEISDPLATAARAERLARSLGLLVVAEAVLLQVILSATGANLIYQFVARWSMVLNLLIYFFACGDWRKELAALSHRLMPNSIGQTLAGLAQRQGLGRILAPLLLPMLLLLTCLRWVLAQTMRYEWGRQASAGFLRQWHEQTHRSASAQLDPVSADYVARFLACPVEARFFAGSVLADLRREIDLRLHGSCPSPSLSMVGSSGTGLTSLNEWVAQEYQSKGKVFRIAIPARTIQPEAVLSLLQPALEWKDQAMVIVEEAHNLFLAYPGGFEGVRTLIDSVMAHPGRLHWLISLNEQAYLFMTRVITNRHGFGTIFRMPPCSEQNLAEWILERHQAAGGDLRYGFSLLRTQEEPRALNAAQEAFFRVLWQQSRGIRKVAQELWFKSLHRDPDRADGWLVDLPPRHDLTALTQASDEMLFVFTAIVRHQNLSEVEAHKVTSLTLREVRHALHLGVESGVLDVQGEGEARYHIHPAWLTDLNTFLRRKNMLYDA